MKFKPGKRLLSDHILILEKNFMKEVFLAYSDNYNLRNEGSSGGVVSQLIINHLQNGGFAVVPNFNKNTLSYENKLITHETQYIQCGSIYHEIDTVKFVRSLNISPRHYLVTCLPCEAKAIRNHFIKHGARITVISLACSGQLKYSATSTLLKAIKVQKEQVDFFRYRGGGWPGGVLVTLKDGRSITCGNFESPWYDIVNSNLFTLDKCFFCADVLGDDSDVTAADPWLPEEIRDERIGKTLVIMNSGVPYLGDNIKIERAISFKDAEYSQRFTLSRKSKQKKYRRYVKFFLVHRRLLKNLIGSNIVLLKLFRKFYSKVWKWV